MSVNPLGRKARLECYIQKVSGVGKLFLGVIPSPGYFAFVEK
jgi:hypothetical protein